MSLSKVEELSMSEDRTARLKAAFLHFCKGNMVSYCKFIFRFFCLLLVAGRQVPIFSYFYQRTPIFPIFQQFPPIFSSF